MGLTLRNIKGSPLTYTEMDNNLLYLESLTGSIASASYALTASYALNGGGGGSTPGGSDTQIQFNSGSVLSGSSKFTYNYSTSAFYVDGTTLSTGGFTGSLQGTSSWAENSKTLNGLDSSSFAITGSNIFKASQVISGSVTITNDLVVLGSSSIQYITSSQLDIADNIISVNAFNPTIRFGGLSVIDSGSSPRVSGSILFDSTNNNWVTVHQGTNTTSSIVITGPETYNDLGNETRLTQYRLTKATATSGDHIGDSNISDNGSVVSINSITEITGSTTISGSLNHGQSNVISGIFAHTEGFRTTASANYSHAEGNRTKALNTYSHAEGSSTIASGSASHAEGSSTIAYGDGSHAEGIISYAIGNYSHAEGGNPTLDLGGGTSYGEGSHAEGILAVSSGSGAHAEGYSTIARGYASHAEGYYSISSGSYSHAEGGSVIEETNGGIAIGEGSHAEGLGTVSNGNGSHAEGWRSTSIGNSSHAEGYRSTSSGSYSHAEGYQTVSYGASSHAEGYRTVASGAYSHAEGANAIALGDYSHTAGNNTIASGSYQNVVGQYNKHNNTTSLFTIGNGASDISRSDIVNVTTTTVQVTGSLSVTGSMYINNEPVASSLLLTNRQTADYTLALSDANKLVESEGEDIGTTINITVPPYSSVDFPTGTQISIAQHGLGITNVVAGIGVTIRSSGGKLKLAGQYSGASLVKIATNEWYLFGDLIS